jgi:hypothetical protein
MMDNDAVTRLREEQMEDGFFSPDYDGYCISNIVPSIKSFFGLDVDRPTLPEDVFDGIEQDREKVVFVLVDGFGFDQWEAYGDRFELFSTSKREGTVTPLTSIFPSTTAAALTTLNTGLTPQEHGVPEYTIFMEELQEVVRPLPMTTVDGFPVQLGTDDTLFRGETIYRQMDGEDIPAFSFVRNEIAGSQYTAATHDGSEIVPYMNLADMAVKLRKHLEEVDGPAYFYVYISFVDTAAHEHGPGSEEHVAQLAAISRVFEEELFDGLDTSVAEDVLWMLSADHGQVGVAPEKTLYLGDIEGLDRYYRESAQGFSIPPTGGARDVFMHIEDGNVDAAIGLLEEQLGDAAAVWRMEEALERGLFGRGEVVDEFRSRTGDLLLLPDEGRTIWYEHVEGEQFDLEGHHGGLSEREMLVPFVAAGLEDLL